MAYSPATEVRSLPFGDLERGSYAGDRWVATARVTQETARGDAVLSVVEGSVHRFWLRPSGSPCGIWGKEYE